MASFTREDTAEKVTQIVEEKLSIPVGTVAPSSSFKDLGADSLDQVELIMTFEEVFGIQIKDEDAEKIKTIDEVISHIHRMRTK